MLLGGGQYGDHAVFDDRLEKRFLAAEVEVERAFGNAGASRHVIQSSGGEALVDKQRERRRREFGWPGVLATTTRGRGFAGSFGRCLGKG